MWGYFEKVPELRKLSVDAIQLDSRINKIFFTLDYLCDTEKGIPLNDLATYISYNLSIKGKIKFKSELLLLGKTSQQIDRWFKFCRYAENQMSRTLVSSKIQTAIDDFSYLIERYVHLTEIVSGGGSPKESLQKVNALAIDMDKFLLNQPYLAQALEETSHVPYGDITEGDLG